MTFTDADRLIARWADSGAAERANYQLFLTELCDLLGVERPAPTTGDDVRNVYVFEKAVTFPNPDGSTSIGRIDLYRRGHFVCETKQGSEKKKEEADPLAPKAKARLGHGMRGTQAWDAAMVAARGQAERYVRAIPDDNPPFVLVIDVGYSIEVYSDFSCLGRSGEVGQLVSRAALQRISFASPARHRSIAAGLSRDRITSKSFDVQTTRCVLHAARGGRVPRRMGSAFFARRLDRHEFGRRCVS